jgi:hypothetical protein
VSAAQRPEFFFDRSLGKVSAALLRSAGWSIHLIADHYPKDAAAIPDAAWVAEGCRRGWALLTKDKKIRYRADEFTALDGHLFCLANGNLVAEQMADRFIGSRSRIERAVRESDGGFWHVYDSGAIRRMG